MTTRWFAYPTADAEYADFAEIAETNNSDRRDRVAFWDVVVLAVVLFVAVFCGLLRNLRVLRWPLEMRMTAGHAGC